MSDASPVVTPILDGRLQCHQPAAGYRFSVDSLLLAHFAMTLPGSRGPFVDLGTGCGVVAAVLGAAGGQGVALELQPGLARCARATLAANGLSNRVRAIRGDLRSLPLAPGSARLVVSNPPYFPAGKGRVNGEGERAQARHEVHCTLAELFFAARYLLPPGGHFCCIYPVARLAEALAQCGPSRLHALRLRFVQPRPHQPASHFLLAARKVDGPALQVAPVLVVADAEGIEGPWYRELLRHVEEHVLQGDGG